MSAWQPMSVRRGLRAAREPQQGIPEHMVRPLVEWFDACFRELPPDRANQRARALALGLGRNPGLHTYQSALSNLASYDADGFLEVIDMLLRAEFPDTDSKSLELVLALGGSVWKVHNDGRSLTERVPVAEAEAYQLVTSVQDDAAENLREAWNRVYGLHRDPDDAWGHAIKACEAMYIPIVTPNNTKGNLGAVIGELDKQPPQWEFRLVHYPSRDSALPALVQMLKVIWVDPNRHAGQPGSRPATQEQAENIVALAVTLVSWARTGVLKRK